MKKTKQLEAISSHLFELKKTERIWGGYGETPANADSSSCEPWFPAGHQYHNKYFQEDWDNNGKIIAWGDNVYLSKINPINKLAV